MLEFVETAYFANLIDNYLGDEAQREIQNELFKNPTKGDLIQGTGGCRKLRVADTHRGKGKRGGFRVIYYLKHDTVYFFDMFAKNEVEDLSPAQKRLLNQVAKEIQ
jgi:hypothetical protein